jgi:glycosyltransferase involved in cell wall biosynthesis
MEQTVTPKVSVIIPCFNAEKFIRPALESVLSQSYENLEIIVVNDGSTDQTSAVISEFKDPRIVFHAQANRGQCAAANAGYRLSTGEYIKFFDADDILDPDIIKLQLDRLNGRTDAIALGQFVRFFGEDYKSLKFPDLSMYVDATPVKWLTDEFSSSEPMMQCALWLIPREIIDRQGLWDERLSLINDFEFFTRILLGAREILYAPGAKIFYRSGVSDSLSGRKDRKSVESAFLSLMLGSDTLLAHENSPATRRACANVLQAFDYNQFPWHFDLRVRVRKRVKSLGGADLVPDGPPGFHALRPYLGWRLSRIVQLAAQSLRFNRASRLRNSK